VKRAAIWWALALTWALAWAPAVKGQSVPAGLRRLGALGLGAAYVLSGHAQPLGDTLTPQERLWLASLPPSRRASLASGEALPTLSLGAQGAVVRLLQARLAALGHPLAMDGVFGPQTQRALAAEQRTLGLAANGVCDWRTWRALFGLPLQAGGRSALALAATYGTSVAALVRWNPSLSWSWRRLTQPLWGTVWLLPWNLLPSPLHMGTGALPTAPVSPTSPAASSPPPGPSPLGVAPPARAFGLVLSPPAEPNSSLTSLAAYLGGHQVSATVVLPLGALEHNAMAVRDLALMGAEVGVRVSGRPSPLSLAQAQEAVARDTGTPPQVGYAGPYPTTQAAHALAAVGLAVVAGVKVWYPGQALRPGEVYLLALPHGSLLPLLATLLTQARRQGLVPQGVTQLLTGAP
jgi:peptidoglycan hydrolase-like protein with peptidoglycan-binding domain